MEDQARRRQVLKYSEAEAKQQYTDLVVASFGAQRKEKPGGTLTARSLRLEAYKINPCAKQIISTCSSAGFRSRPAVDLVTWAGPLLGMALCPRRSAVLGCIRVQLERNQRSQRRATAGNRWTTRAVRQNSRRVQAALAVRHRCLSLQVHGIVLALLESFAHLERGNVQRQPSRKPPPPSRAFHQKKNGLEQTHAQKTRKLWWPRTQQVSKTPPRKGPPSKPGLQKRHQTACNRAYAG